MKSVTTFVIGAVWFLYSAYVALMSIGVGASILGPGIGGKIVGGILGFFLTPVTVIAMPIYTMFKNQDAALRTTLLFWGPPVLLYGGSAMVAWILERRARQGVT